MSESFGKYLLLERIATGGMAEVYLAKSKASGGVNKFVAIKRILPQYSDNPEFVEMFKEEAKIAVNLNHSNVVSIHDFGVETKQFFLVMEYVEGLNLRQILNHLKKENKYFGIDQITYVAKEIAAGLDHAHRCLDATTGKPLNITHRDMSPQNVMISFEGEVKIVDFGIAKAENQMESTKAGTIKGKYGYMSPEQAEGQIVDLRTDIFSTGIVLWELLANDRLFTAGSEAATLRKIRECNIPSLRKINPSIPSELEKICLKALTKDRNNRYQSASSLHRDLNRFLNTQYPDFSSQDFSVFMKSSFSQMFNENRRNLVEYAKLTGEPEKLVVNSTPSQLHIQQPPPAIAANEPPIASPIQQSNSVAIPNNPVAAALLNANELKANPTSLQGLPGLSSSSTQSSAPKPSISPQVSSSAQVRRPPSKDPAAGWVTKSQHTHTGTGATTSQSGQLRRRKPKKKKSGLGSLVPLALVSGGIYFALAISPIGQKLGLKHPLGSASSNIVKATEEEKQLRSLEMASKNRIEEQRMYNFQVRSDPSGAQVSINGEDKGFPTPAQFKEIANRPVRIGLTLNNITYLFEPDHITQEGQILLKRIDQNDMVHFAQVEITVVNGGDNIDIYFDDVLVSKGKSSIIFSQPAGKNLTIRAYNTELNLGGQVTLTTIGGQRHKINIPLQSTTRTPATGTTPQQ